MQNAPMSIRIETNNAPEQQQVVAPRRQLNQLDQDIERLRQITREAEEIRNRIAQEQGQIPRPSAQPMPQAPRRGRGQIPSATVVLPRAGQGQRQNQPLLSRPGVQAVINNMPQMIDQLRNAFNNNLDRIQNTYQRIQGRLTNMQAENQRLRDENQQLRDENQKLRKRLQDKEQNTATENQ